MAGADVFRGWGRVRVWGLIGAACLSWASAATRGQSAPDGPRADERKYPYRVVATVGMVADIVRHVAGGRAEVTNIIGEGVDPHLYKPTRGDVAAMLKADVVFYNGLVLEGKMSDTLIRVASSGKPVFAVTELLEERYLLEPPEFAGHYDPHVWMDVGAWMKATEAVAEALGRFDPSNAGEYRSNAATYVEELKRLDAYVRRVIASIPEHRRVLITAHDAFNYFGRAYGIRVEGVQGLSTESEAGLERINRLVDDIVQNQVTAVFIETSVSDKNVRALVEGARARGWEVRIGGKLFSDAMGAPGTYEGTYIGMIDHNATTIARALGGDAPPGGMLGRLAAKD